MNQDITHDKAILKNVLLIDDYSKMWYVNEQANQCKTEEYYKLVMKHSLHLYRKEESTTTKI